MIHMHVRPEEIALVKTLALVGMDTMVPIAAHTHALEQVTMIQTYVTDMEHVLLRTPAHALEATRVKTALMLLLDSYTLWETVAVDKWEMVSNSHPLFHHQSEGRYWERYYRLYLQEVNSQLL